MKYLHIGPNSRIYTDFIEFVEENFDKKEHKFYISEDSENFNNIASKWLNKQITAEVVEI